MICWLRWYLLTMAGNLVMRKSPDLNEVQLTPGAIVRAPLVPHAIVLSSLTGQLSLALWRAATNMLLLTVHAFCAPQNSPAMVEAKAWLAVHPLELYPRAEPWNGGCSQQQLKWLEQQLTEAAAEGAEVVVTSHHPLAPGSAPDRYLAWNYDEILGIINKYPGVVTVAFAGHYHPGGYCLLDGVHYVTLEGMVEAPCGSNAYAVLEIGEGQLGICGRGVTTSRILRWRGRD